MITSLVEKKGGLWRLNAESTTFNQMIEDLHVIDIEMRQSTKPSPGTTEEWATARYLDVLIIS